MERNKLFLKKGRLKSLTFDFNETNRNYNKILINFQKDITIQNNERLGEHESYVINSLLT